MSVAPPVFPDLKDMSVFVTGGASGIGAALVEGFAAQGAKTAFCDLLDGTSHADTVEKATGNRPLVITCDVTDTQALRAALDQAAEAHGPIATLVNNAANDTRVVADEVTPGIWDGNLALNLDAHFHAARHVAPMMRSLGGGSIINFSSVTWMMGSADIVPYVTAKAGIVGMTRALAREWGGDMIRVNAIVPGWVFTERQLRLWAKPDAVEAFLARQCLPVKLQPADMVAPVLFLASSASRMITGQCLPVDAGVVHTG